MENFNIGTFLPFYPNKCSICLQKHKHSLIFKNNYILLFEEWKYSGWCKDLESNCGECWNYAPPSSTQAQAHKLTHHWKCNQVKLIYLPRNLCNSCLFLAMSSFCPFHFTFLTLPVSHKSVADEALELPSLTIAPTLHHFAGSKYHASHSKFILMASKVTQLPNVTPSLIPFFFTFLQVTPA